jgi:microcompartment protein CcmK/EutM
MARKYSSISVATTLNGTISSSTTTIQVATGTAALLLGGVTLAAGNVDQFAIAIDPDTASEEICFVTAVSGDILTIVRARASSTALTHTTGATIQHVLTGEDLDYFKSLSATEYITAKGDLLAGTASGAIDNVAVGTNDFALVADSSAATGVSYKKVILGTSIGANGTVLTADSTIAAGYKWAGVDTGNSEMPFIMGAY